MRPMPQLLSCVTGHEVTDPGGTTIGLTESPLEARRSILGNTAERGTRRPPDRVCARRKIFYRGRIS
jgi:hypothetical protein